MDVIKALQLLAVLFILITSSACRNAPKGFRQSSTNTATVNSNNNAIAGNRVRNVRSDNQKSTAVATNAFNIHKAVVTQDNRQSFDG